jgi:hypothetical protein
MSDHVYKVEWTKTEQTILFDTRTRGCSVTGISQLNKKDWMVFSYCEHMKNGSFDYLFHLLIY